MRLQVYLSHNGVCSRRKALEMIQSGFVKVNGVVQREPSTPIDTDKDKVYVDGKTISQKNYEYLLFNKPAGYVTTKSDQNASRTIYDLLPKRYKHLSPVGRLDKNTEGLLLLTNDGDVTYKLTHPKFGINKVYFVRVKGLLEANTKRKIEKGIFIEGKRTAPAQIRSTVFKKDFTQLYIVIHEGRKRQIRIMFSKMGHKVIFLKRIEQGPLKLNKLKTGETRLLTKGEIESLKDL